MKVAAVIPAAGLGRRLRSSVPKPFIQIAGKPLLAHTLLNLRGAFSFTDIVVAVAPPLVRRTSALLKEYGLDHEVRVVVGGRTRAESVRNAVLGILPSCEWILVHDAARPLVDSDLVARLLKAAKSSGAALCALPSTATVKDVKAGRVCGTLNRRNIFLAQTPQVFRKKFLLERYRKLGKKALGATDEAALFDGSRVRTAVVDGEVRNIKITTPDDVRLFQFYLNGKR